MTARKVVFVSLGIPVTFGILWWLESPRTAAGLEVVVAAIFCAALFSRTRSREPWALALFALVAFLFLLTGVGDFWCLGGASSAGAYRAMSIAGLSARGIALGCIIALAASGELHGKKRMPPTLTI
jgi:hypothetical protein